MKKLFLLCVMVIFWSESQCQIYNYLDTYDTSGVPEHLVNPGDYVDQTTIDNIYNILPERQENLDYVDTMEYLNLKLDTATKVWISMITEGAGFTNALAVYYYQKGNPPSTIGDIDTLNIVFPNASMHNSSGELHPGDKVYIDSFPPSTVVGFALIANGWDDNSDTVNAGIHKYFSNYNLNPEVPDSLKPHNVVFWDTDALKYILGFEDLKRTDGGCDHDFNDCIFYITIDPLPVFNDSTNPQPPSPTPDDGGGLPVSYYSINLFNLSGINVLQWFTASEINNDFFEIQRSEDGVNFKSVGHKKGMGTTNVMIKYSFKDMDVLPNHGYYYRLVQVDFDGRKNISRVLYIKVLCKSTTISIFPNPALQGTSLSFEINNINSDMEIDLFDINGHIVSSQKVLPAQQYRGEFSTVNLAKGIYFMEVNGIEFRKRLKIIVL